MLAAKFPVHLFPVAFHVVFLSQVVFLLASAVFVSTLVGSLCEELFTNNCNNFIMKLCVTNIFAVPLAITAKILHSHLLGPVEKRRFAVVYGEKHVTKYI